MRAVGMVAALAAGALLLTSCLVSAGSAAGDNPAHESTPPATPGQDATPEPTPTPLPPGEADWTERVDTIPFDDVRRLAFALPEFDAQAGEVIAFDGVLAVRSPIPALQAAQIRCTRGTHTYESTYTTRNAGADPDAVDALPVRWLFRPPLDGAYRCALYGHADHATEPDTYALRVVAHPATRLEMDRKGIIDGHVWRLDRDLEVTNRATRNLFRHVTEAVPRARSLRWYAGIEVTNNYEGRRRDYDSEVVLRLTVTQLDGSGRSCGQSWNASARHRIPREVHHDKLELGFESIPVRVERGCTRRFEVRGSLELAAGSPVTVHGPRYSDLTVQMR